MHSQLFKGRKNYSKSVYKPVSRGGLGSSLARGREVARKDKLVRLTEALIKSTYNNRGKITTSRKINKQIIKPIEIKTKNQLKESAREVLVKV